jgi:hypothetical protein
MSRTVSILTVAAMIVLFMAVAGSLVGSAASQSPQSPEPSALLGTAFTYQGYLTESGSPADGEYDFRFSLYDEATAGNLVGSTQDLGDITVVDGLFGVELDFGPVFGDAALWLEIGVRPGDEGGTYDTLDPRQRLTPTPFAMYASGAPWSGLTGVPSGFDDQVDDDTLAELSCGDGQIAEWDGAAWVCGDDDVGAGGGDIAAVYAGDGLLGGGEEGSVTLHVAGGTGMSLSADSLSITPSFRLPQTCTDGQLPTWDEGLGEWVCGDDADTTYAAGTGLDLAGTTFAITPTYQLPQTCGGGEIPEWSGSGWVCGTDDVGSGSGGDITAVIAGYGLDGGAPSGDATLYVVTGTIQTRVSEACPAGWSIRSIDQDGNVVCEQDDDTTYSPGTGLHLAGTTLAITTTYQLPQACTDGQLPKWDESSGEWACTDDASTNSWSLSGNTGTVPGTDFLGTTDEAALELHVYGSRAWRLEPGTTSPNVLGGYAFNNVATGVSGASIGGGGLDLAINQVTADFGTISGGAGNTASGYAATVGGGYHNVVTATYGTIAGGGPSEPGNPTTTNNRVFGAYGTIGGGGDNTADNGYATVSGGSANTAGGYASSIGGGAGNGASNGYATVAGGTGNMAGGQYTAIGGGSSNTASDSYAIVAGGRSNSASAGYAMVGGGYGNVVTATASYGTIGGGYGNVVTATASYGTIGGGYGNVVTATATYGAIPGGLQNWVGGSRAVVGGGESNVADADYGTVGGGYRNVVTATYGTIAGGGPWQLANPTTTNNRVFGDYGTIGGGGGNVVTATYGTIAGGQRNRAENEYATVAGGSDNSASGSAASIGGGFGNGASKNYATVGGGTGNTADGQYATIGGGGTNVVTATYGTIAGGFGNVVTTTAAAGTIPGGLQNYVGGSFSLAAGRQARAEHTGTFVWSDSSATAFSSTGPDQFLINASGGVGIGTNNPSHMLTVDGSTAILGSGQLTARGVYTNIRPFLDAPSAIDAAGSLVYVTSYSTNTLTILDVSDPEFPFPLGWTTSNMNGPVDVQVVGQHAYVASQLNHRLVVLDVSNPFHPDSLGSTDHNLGNPLGVYVSGKYAYVASSGREDGSRDGLAIFDISDPTNIAASDFITTNLAATSDVYVSGQYAYVTSHGNNRLAIFDVSDPRRIVAQGTTSYALDAPTAVHVRGRYAYVVAENSNNLVIFDVSDPNNITFVDESLTSPTSLTRPRSVFLSGDYAYVAFAGEPLTASQCGLAVFDVSDPAAIAVLSVIDMSDSQPGPEKPVFVSGDGTRIYVANEVHDSLAIYDANRHLDAPVVHTGELQTAYLDVVDAAAVQHDLTVQGGLQVGPGGALIQGALSVAGQDDSHILGALSVGGAGALISDTVFLTRTQWIAAPTHALDVIGEGRFRVNDYTNLVLRSANAGADEDAYIDFVRSDQTDVLTPTARIEFDAADPFTHSTSIRFSTQAAGDPALQPRVEIAENGNLRPAVDNKISLGESGRRWTAVWAVNGTIQTSDGRLKENVAGLPYGLDAVRRLRPVAFTWKDGLDDRQHYGLIAQEVAQVLPDLVIVGDDAAGTLSLNYAEVVPVLVKAVQEQQEEIDTQNERIAALEARLSALEGAQGGQAAWPGWLDKLSPLWLGGLVLGALVLVGRRLGGPS